MGRNKYPEQTVEKIIITAARLFSEKGYEQTSIQDILDALMGTICNRRPNPGPQPTNDL